MSRFLHKDQTVNPDVCKTGQRFLFAEERATNRTDVRVMMCKSWAQLKQLMGEDHE